MLFYSGFALIIILLLFFFMTLRTLTISKHNLNSSWDELVSLWKKRYDLVSRLVDSTKSDIADKKIFHYVLHAKNECHLASNQLELVNANNTLSIEYGRLLEIAVSSHLYDGDDDFYALHNELVCIEEKLAFTWSFYREYTAKYNRIVLTFPTNAVASLCNFRSRKHLN